jgi:hypothetical protein
MGDVAQPAITAAAHPSVSSFKALVIKVAPVCKAEDALWTSRVALIMS